METKIVNAIPPASIGLMQSPALNTAALQRAQKADHGGLQANQEIKNTATEFEAVMLSMLVREMRQTGGEEGLFPGDKSDTMGGM